jgi:acetyl esterase/lipase
MDASVSNPEIALLDKTDPMLSRAGVVSAKRMAALDGDLDDVRISPIRGNFSHFPTTVMFLAEADITYPDQRIVAQKMTDAKVALTIIVGKGMPHIWPFLPVMKEAKKALGEIITSINKTTLN